MIDTAKCRHCKGTGRVSEYENYFWWNRIDWRTLGTPVLDHHTGVVTCDCPRCKRSGPMDDATAKAIARTAANIIVSRNLWFPDDFPTQYKRTWWRRILFRRRNHHGLPELILDSVGRGEEYALVSRHCFISIMSIIEMVAKEHPLEE